MNLTLLLLLLLLLLLWLLLQQMHTFLYIHTPCRWHSNDENLRVLLFMRTRYTHTPHSVSHNHANLKKLDSSITLVYVHYNIMCILLLPVLLLLLLLFVVVFFLSSNSILNNLIFTQFKYFTRLYICRVKRM